MNILVTIMLVLFLVLLFLPLLGSGYFPKVHYKIQKVILEKMLPKSPEDIVTLMVGGLLLSLSFWCVLLVILKIVTG